MRHVRTDPRCERFRRPATPWTRWWYNRNRGRLCQVCNWRRAHSWTR